MNIIFFMLHPGYVRNYESVIRGLAERGHKIHVCFSQTKKQSDDKLIERLAMENSNVSFQPRPSPKASLVWRYMASAIRGGRDYIRYFHPRYANATELKNRVEERLGIITHPFVRTLFKLLNRMGLIGLLDRVFITLENALPRARNIEEFIKERKADLVLVTPVVNMASLQVDYIKSAKYLGVRCAVCVASWDNLTNKGLIRVEPDAVFVWNDIQKQEAVEMHHIPEEKVIVTGAQCYDKWFEFKPSSTKEGFMKRIGLDPGVPYLLYVCSSPFIAPDEVGFVEKWIQSIRNSDDPYISNMGILIRPHPQNAEQWKDVDFSHYGNVVIYPRAGENPVDEITRNNYYDSIYHSQGVVGINTSAMIESGILLKPVFTTTSPEFEKTQEGTLHFHYLVKGGLLYMSRNMDEHLEQLKRVLSSDDRSYVERIRNFIKDFVRPHGLDVPATPVFVEAIEKMVDMPAPSAEKVPLWSYPLRPVMLFMGTVLILSKGALKKWIKEFKESRREKKTKKPQKAVEKKAGEGIAQRILRMKESMLRRISPASRPKNPEKATRKGTALPVSEMKPYMATIKEIKRIARSDKPVLVGPWISEVGFEILYWIPFLNWAINEYRIDRERLTIISRGGTAPWYADMGERYVDVFDFFTPEEFKQKNQKRIEVTGGQKHNNISEFDREIIEHVRKKLEIDEFEWFHPSFMYQMFRLYWSRQVPVTFIERHTRYRSLDSIPSTESMVTLPDEYVAVKFYFSQCFPDTPENRHAVAELLQAISSKTNVVLLSTNIDIDDHSDYHTDMYGSIHPVKDNMDVRNNLAIQTAIIARAKAFIGTYGGFSYVAPFCGVPSVSFYSSEDKFLPVHLDVAHRAFRMLKFGAFDKVPKKAQKEQFSTNGRRYEFMALNINNLDILDYISFGEVGYDSRLQRTGKA